ncbi:MAG: hypothetical protein KKB37_10490, partial [Alphaproteobacteria bacterium]|nr:hypothetical protein [Alphaproteobacteria bacterium]
RDPLADAVRLIAREKVTPPALVLAAAVGAEGHWTFANQAGQRFTAAGVKEAGRVYQALAPEIRGKPGPVVIFVTGASVFAHGEHLDSLPEGARRRMVSEGTSYPLIGLGGKKSRRWLAQVAPNVFVHADEKGQFQEAVWQLSRPLRARAIRILALDAEGPDTFRPTVRPGDDGAHAIDAINPGKLASALGTLRRQTALLTGRLERDDVLVYRTATAVERDLDLKPLRLAAAQSDINLIFVNAAAPRQPGVRNWLWLRAEVDGLSNGLGRETLGGFLATVAGGSDRVAIELHPRGASRVRLSVVPLAAAESERGPGTFSSMLAEIVSEVAGNVLPYAIDADLVTQQRQQELDRRLVPGIPSAWQFGFAGALLAGLLGLPIALSWWRRIWPPEQRADSAGGAGFAAARLVRWLVFFALFLPVAGLAAVLAGIIRGVGYAFGRRARPRAGDGADAGAMSG